jgi:hypothetical protein
MPKEKKGSRPFSLRNSLGVNALEIGQMLILAGAMRQPTTLILKNFVQGRPLPSPLGYLSDRVGLALKG